MKRIIGVIITLIITGLIFSACGSKSAEESGKSTVSRNVSFKNVYGFSEGLAFAQSDEKGKTFCIDKKGNIVFTLDGEYMPSCGFKNGIAIINDAIVDKEGNITSPKDLGGDSFLIDKEIYEKAFADGYILLSKSTSGFSGGKDEIAVLNSSLEVLVPFSEKLYEDINSEKYTINATEYYNGILYFCDSDEVDALYLDTGKREVIDGENVDRTFLSSIKSKHQSDFWIYNMNYERHVIDRRTGEYPSSFNIDLTQYEETLDNIVFNNGNAEVMFSDEKADGIHYFFTLIDENGKFLFDPVEVLNYQYKTDGDKFLFTYPAGQDSVYIQIIDKKGNEKKTTLEYENAAYIDISDGIIIHNDIKKITAYDSDFNKLF